ncbi:MAG: Gfo/Idh/MocA family protein [Verrucomicrobiales bacterium]
MEKNSNMSVGGDSRRTFIKKSATAAAAVAATSLITPVYGQNQAPSANVKGANDRLVVGFIGVGGQGMAHVRSQKGQASSANIALAAVADVWSKRVEGAKQTIGGECQGYDDYRRLLERKDIDAVTISSVDHWHTIQSIDAMNSGKHVYVEKPMTRYLGEAFDIETAVKKTGKILQVGSQGCSDAKWHKAAELIRAGKIGPLVLGQGSYMRNNPKGEWNYTIDPSATRENLNWQSWLGPVNKKVDFNADHYFRWRKYYPYCAGLLGDLFPHRLHPLMLATGNPEFPSRVVSIGTKKVLTDKNTPGTPIRDVPENVQLLAEFPSGLTLMVTSSSINEVGIPDLIRGHHATVYFGGNRVELKPEKAFADDVDPETYEGLKPGEDVAVHERNWFDSIRANKQPNGGIDLAVKVQTVISLAEMSERLGIACLFDEKTRKVTTGDGKEVKPITYGTLELS